MQKKGVKIELNIRQQQSEAMGMMTAGIKVGKKEMLKRTDARLNQANGAIKFSERVKKQLMAQAKELGVKANQLDLWKELTSTEKRFFRYKNSLDQIKAIINQM